MRRGIALLSSNNSTTKKTKLIRPKLLLACQISAILSTFFLWSAIVIVAGGNIGNAIFVLAICLVDPSKSQVIIRSVKLGKEYKRVFNRIEELLKN